MFFLDIFRIVKLAMLVNFFNLGGYWIFIIPAFVATFSVLILLYLKTARKLKKLESLFSMKFSQQEISKIAISKQRKIEKRILSTASK